MTGVVHIMSVLAILAIAGAGFAHMLGAARVRDRLAGAAFVLVALLLFLPGLVAVLDGISPRFAADSPSPGPAGAGLFALALVGHTALAIEIVRRRTRREAPGREAERARTRMRARVPIADEGDDEELP